MKVFIHTITPCDLERRMLVDDYLALPLSFGISYMRVPSLLRLNMDVDVVTT